MSDDRPVDRFRENVTEITAVVVTGIWLTAMFTGRGWWLAALLVGYIVLVPIVALLFGDEEDRAEWWEDDWDSWGWPWGKEDDAETEDASGSAVDAGADGQTTAEPSTRDALETLRERYARGELTDEQFEAKLERLLGTETVENAEEWIRQRERAREQRQRELE